MWRLRVKAQDLGAHKKPRVLSLAPQTEVRGEKVGRGEVSHTRMMSSKQRIRDVRTV